MSREIKSIDELDDLKLAGAICVKIDSADNSDIRSVELWLEPIMKRRKAFAWCFNSYLLDKNTNDYYALLPLQIFDYEALIEMKKNYKDRIFWLTQIYQKYDVPITMEGKWEKMLKS